MKDIDELEKENKKLKNELNKLKSLQKVVDSLKMSRREQLSNLDTESMSLDYLRPYDFEDQRDNDELDDNNEEVTLKNKTTRLRGGRRPKEDEDEYQKKKSEQGARALMRIRRAQERKRKQEEEDAEKYALHKSAKITKIANELEETLKHRREEEEQNEKENNKNDNEEENTPIFSVAGSKRKRGNQYNY